MEGWRSQDASTFFGVDKTLLHQALRQEQAELKKQWRWARRGWSVGSAVLFISAALFLAIVLFQPNDDGVRIVWDYVVGVVDVAAAIIVAGALFAQLRSRQACEQGFGVFSGSPAPSYRADRR